MLHYEYEKLYSKLLDNTITEKESDRLLEILSMEKNL